MAPGTVDQKYLCLVSIPVLRLHKGGNSSVAQMDQEEEYYLYNLKRLYLFSLAAYWAVHMPYPSHGHFHSHRAADHLPMDE